MPVGKITAALSKREYSDSHVVRAMLDYTAIDGSGMRWGKRLQDLVGQAIFITGVSAPPGPTGATSITFQDHVGGVNGLHELLAACNDLLLTFNGGGMLGGPMNRLRLALDKVNSA